MQSLIAFLIFWREVGGGREIEWKVRDILSNQSLLLQHSQGFWRLNMNYVQSCHKYWKVFCV